MPAEDAIVVDSTELSIEKVVAQVERLIAAKERACSAG
jgi:cytidylate kinase